MRTKARCVVLVVGMLVIRAAPDDFLHQQQNTLVLSDRVLSGVEPHYSTIEDVIAKFGKPSAVTIRLRAEGPLTVEQRNYEWQRKECQLRVVTAESYGGNVIESIDVWGTAPVGDMCTTGRGLKLGDSIRDVRRIYALRLYFGITLPERTPPCLGEPILEVDLNKAGKINHMKVRQTTACY